MYARSVTRRWQFLLGGGVLVSFFGSVLFFVTAHIASAAAPGVVVSFPARTVMHPANKTGESDAGGLIENIEIPPGDEYYLDYTLNFRIFDWDTREQSGKIPGLAGGTGTAGCRATEPDGWSARQTFDVGGKMTSYLYYQDRPGSCGDKFAWKNPDGTDFKFTKGKVYRVTQRVKINTPGVANGEDEIWVDGVRVFLKTNLKWRGNVAPSVARISQLKYHSYFGGKSFNDTPSFDSYIDYGPLYVMSCPPDFTKPPGSCGSAATGSGSCPLKNDLFLNPFNKNSAHHKPIGTGAIYAPTTDERHLDFAHFGRFGINVGSPYGNYAVKLLGTGINITVNKKEADASRLPATIPMPLGGVVLDSTAPDNQIVIFDMNPGGRMHHVRGYEWRGGNPVGMQYREYAFNSLGHNGTTEAERGTTASKVAAPFGILRGYEANTPGVPIQHALQMIGPRRPGEINCPNVRHMLGRTFIAPADGMDSNALTNPSYNLGSIPYGTLFAIPPESKGGPNLESLGLSEAGLRLARAVRDYGIYLIDGGGCGPAIRADQDVNKDLFINEIPKFYPHIRVVTNSEWNLADIATGGGTPIAPNCAFDSPDGGGTGPTGTPTGPVGVGGGTAVFFTTGNSDGIECPNFYTSEIDVPEGYGAAYNVFSTSSELVFQSTGCVYAGAITLEGGSNPNTTIVSRTGYYWTGSAWKTFYFAGTAVPGTDGQWLRGGAEANLPFDIIQTYPKRTYFVAHTCTLVAGNWRCGCANAACANPLWQLQAIRATVTLQNTTGAGWVGGVGSCPLWQDFAEPFSVVPTRTIEGELGITESDLALVIQIRTGDSAANSRLRARAILAAHTSLASLDIDSPIVIDEEVPGLVVRYKDETIMTYFFDADQNTHIASPVSFDNLPVADRPGEPGVGYVIETMIRHNFRPDGPTIVADFLVRTTLIGCSGSGVGTPTGTPTGTATGSTGTTPDGPGIGLCYPSLSGTTPATPSNLDSVLAGAAPGDRIVLAPGTYAGNYTYNKNASQASPIIIEGGTGVIMTGRITMGGSYGVIKGIRFMGGGEKISLTGHHIRITRNTFSGQNVGGGGIINTEGNGIHDNRIDHNLFENFRGAAYRSDGWSANGATDNQNVRLDHNHFINHTMSFDLSSGSGNESVVLMLGDAYTDSLLMYDYNLFDRVMQGDSEEFELVSIKTAATSFRANTIINTAKGTISLRQTNHSVIEDNYTEGNVDIRVHGDNHLIKGNRLVNGEILVAAGDGTMDDRHPGCDKSATSPVFPPPDCRGLHAAARNTTVENNDAVVVVGEAYPNDNVPAQNTTLRNNRTVNLVTGKHTNTNNSGGTPTTNPLKLQPNQVGPGSADPSCPSN